MTGLPLAFSILVASGVLLGFIGLWRMTTVEDVVEARLRQFGGAAAGVAGTAPPASKGKRFGGLNQTLARMSLGESIANRLSRADMPLTVAEFLLIALMIAGALALLGWLRGGFLLSIVLGITGLFLPGLYLNVRANRRRDAFTNQLPDVLTLLVGALRAGYGVTQAIDMLVERMAKPASVEFGRVMRAVNLGMPVNRALNDMADRSGSDDLYLMVTAMNVQAEVGGNLAQILETITETVRERIRIKREIQVLTAQQRMTGYLLAILPIAFGVAVSLVSPGYLDPLFQPGMMRLVLITGVAMMVIGFLIIRKIVDIEV
jgi:tight adherence protein B